jgi:hypothetical protein
MLSNAGRLSRPLAPLMPWSTYFSASSQSRLDHAQQVPALVLDSLSNDGSSGIYASTLHFPAYVVSLD